MDFLNAKKIYENDGLHVYFPVFCRFKNVLFEITATETAGVFDVNARFMGVSMEKVELVFQVIQTTATKQITCVSVCSVLV